MDINTMLYRPLKNGNEFNPLIPKSNCTSKFLGNGMTDFSISQMANVVQEYYLHMAKVAPLLKKQTLQRTCNAIHDFAYSHFQYKADKAKQYLRSPACSWSVRHEGIDCKSYSIVASAILLNLGIKHSIRRVRQPGTMPHLWTHVYVIVPIDQDKGNLSKGYHTIDGTIPEPIELPYIEKHDINMEHYGLAAPALIGLRAGETSTTDTSAATSSNSGQSASGLLSKFRGIFGKGWSLNCFGGTYDNSHVTGTIYSVVPWFINEYTMLNSLVAQNSSAVKVQVNRILTNSAQLKDHAEETSKKDWSSDCSAKATKDYAELGIYYGNVATDVFRPWLEQYFDVTYTTKTVKNNNFAANVGFKKDNFVRDITVQVVNTMALKSSTTSVAKFVFTEYVANKDNAQNFNVQEALSGMRDVIAVFGGSTGGTSNGGTVYPGTKPGTVKNPVSSGGTGTLKPVTGTNQTMGGGILGVVLLLAGGGYLLSNAQKKATPPAAQKSTSTKSK